MIFNSIAFVAFFVVVTTLFFSFPHKYRWMLLLTASCFFYMYFVPVYILILGFTIVVDYLAGIYIARSEGAARKWLLVCSLVANIGILAFFKYYNFLNTQIATFLGVFGYDNPVPYLQILLPIGLSFHTFQAMSYTIEVYRGHQPPEKHLGIYALYVMFYPQLVAGPIERPQNILPQLHAKQYFEYDNVVSGLRLMLWGFIKKLVIADRLAIYVNAVFDNAHTHSGTSMLIAAFFFRIQLYCDFSGYSDIAIGAARVMGFKLMTNFRRPVLISKGFKELWQRWHISLSTWLRDYLYFPLGGSRKGKMRTYINIMIVFAVSGFWHGAGYNFIIWGLLNGVFLIGEHLLDPYLKKVHNWLGNAANLFRRVTVFFLISMAGIFFRAQSFDTAWYMIQSIFTLKKGGIFRGEPPSSFGYYSFAVLFLLTVEHIQEFHPHIKVVTHRNVMVRYTGYVVLLLLLLLLGVFNGGQFIYFQF